MVHNMVSHCLGRMDAHRQADMKRVIWFCKANKTLRSLLALAICSWLTVGNKCNTWGTIFQLNLSLIHSCGCLSVSKLVRASSTNVPLLLTLDMNDFETDTDPRTQERRVWICERRKTRSLTREIFNPYPQDTWLAVGLTVEAPSLVHILSYIRSHRSRCERSHWPSYKIWFRWITTSTTAAKRLWVSLRSHKSLCFALCRLDDVDARKKETDRKLSNDESFI